MDTEGAEIGKRSRSVEAEVLGGSGSEPCELLVATMPLGPGLFRSRRRSGDFVGEKNGFRTSFGPTFDPIVLPHS